MYKIKLSNLNCAHCASKIENEIKKQDYIKDCSLNFSSSVLKVESDLDEYSIIHNLNKIIKMIEPDVEIVNEYSEHSHLNTNTMVLFLGFIIFIFAFIIKEFSTQLFLISYFLLGFNVLKNSFRGNIFDENFLMSIATLSAIYLKEYKEAVFVMLFYQMGEIFQDKAVDKSRKNISDLMSIKPDYANVLVNEEFIKRDLKDVKVGDIILVKGGEKIPVDGVVLSGNSLVDTSSLTGESLSVEVEESSEVISGSINLTGVLKIKASKIYEDSTVNKIIKLLEESTDKKSNSEKFISRFSKVYTPIVVLISILVVLLSPFFNVSFNEALQRSATLLLISCPCALVISVPLSFFSGIGSLSRNSILVKSSNIIEKISKVKNIVLDKTGTLTYGKFYVEDIIGGDEVLKLASYAEYNSNHPIAKSILEKYEGNIDLSLISDVVEYSGYGVYLKVNGDEVLVGNKKLMDNNNIHIDIVDRVGSIVYVSKNKKYIGQIVINDKIKEESKVFADNPNVYMLTGDNKKIADKVANELKIKNVYSECLPQDKLSIVKQLKQKGITLFVGDGINDAVVLLNSDIGISMGNIGSDVAIEASDVVIMDDDVSKVLFSIEHCKKIMMTVKINVAFALISKFIILILGIFGFSNMIIAIFADVGVSIICILNSIRLLKNKNFNVY